MTLRSMASRSGVVSRCRLDSTTPQAEPTGYCVPDVGIDQLLNSQWGSHDSAEHCCSATSTSPLTCFSSRYHATEWWWLGCWFLVTFV